MGKRENLEKLMDDFDRMGQGRIFGQGRNIKGNVKNFFNEIYSGFWEEIAKDETYMRYVREITNNYRFISCSIVENDKLIGDAIDLHMSKKSLMDDWAEAYRKSEAINKGLMESGAVIYSDRTIEEALDRNIKKGDYTRAKAVVEGLYCLIDFSEQNYKILENASSLTTKYRRIVKEQKDQYH